MSFVEKYRPTKPEQLIGDIQRKVAKGILDVIESDEKITAILLEGPSGSGKTTIAQMIAAEYVGWDNINNPMVVERVNSSSETSINFIRDNFKPSLNTPPMYSKYLVWIFDEVHGWSKEAQNALLDSTEPEHMPEHIVIIATTSEPKKLIPALSSRFSTHKLKTPSYEEQKRLVSAISKREGIDLSPDLIQDLLDEASGNIRTLVHNLEKVKQGTFVRVDSVEEDNMFFQELFFRNSGLKVLFEAAEEVSDYTSMSVRMAHAAITMIKKNNKYAEFVLDVFGEGLSSNTSPRASFYNKLLKIHRMKNE